MDAARFTSLFERHRNNIHAAARKNGAVDPDDVTAEAFARLWANRSKIGERDADAANWLYRVTFNLCKDSHRHWKRIDYQPVPDDRPDTSAGDLVGRFMELTADLAPRQRQALFLYHGLSVGYPEAGSLLGISGGAAKQAGVRGLENLRKTILTRV